MPPLKTTPFRHSSLKTICLLLVTLLLYACQGESEQAQESEKKTTNTPETEPETYNRPPYQEPENQYLKHKVKTQKEYITTYEEGKEQKSRHLAEVTQYNEQGEPLSIRHYEATGDLLYSKQLSYNEAGNLVLSQRMEADGTASSRDSLYYDDKGNKVSMVYSDEMLGTYKTSYEYDEKGRLVRERGESGAAPGLSVDDRSYAKDGYLREIISYTVAPDGQKTNNAKESFTYNDKGQMSERYKKSFLLEVETRDTYQYDDQGRKILRSTKAQVREKNQTLDQTFEYNEKGLLKLSDLTNHSKNYRVVKEFEYAYW